MMMQWLALLPHSKKSEIVNGIEVPDGKMPYMVSLQNNKNGHVCGGFLISEDFVVTAAHCDNGLKHVILGRHNWKNSNVKKIEISNQCKHKNYSDVVNGYDIMLLKVNFCSLQHFSISSPSKNVLDVCSNLFAIR
uniref:trypsin n=1 Tax=Oryzias latipes TaxID=8090 RepID=A0A3P9IMB9_ORYLA